MSTINQQQSSSPMMNEPLPPQVNIARQRSRQVYGRNLKCKFCKSADAWISLERNVHMVNCPTCDNKYLSDTEYIIYVRESGVPLYGTYHTKKKWFLQENGKSEWEHPTVKPINIIATLIENSSLINDLIYDPFMGSGTTARACMDLKRNYIGSEISSEYCEIIKKRLAQQTLL